MRYGLGIFLIVVGAILSFAVKKHISGVDLTMIGYIFMGAGVLALLFEVMTASARRERSVTRERTIDAPSAPVQGGYVQGTPAQGGPVVERERLVERDDNPNTY